MDETAKVPVELAIAHVLFIDIVGYSKLTTRDQNAAVATLNETVQGCEPFQIAERADRILKIPTGDGMALVFYRSPEEPAECAVALARALKQHSNLPVRMGIHSGSVSGVVDVSGRANVAGAGINIAQRVMDCADAGHILVSKHAADDLAEYERWHPLLHDLGSCEVKHGVKVHVVSLCDDSIGNSGVPSKLRTQRLRIRRRRLIWIGAVTALLGLTTALLLFWRAREKVRVSSVSRTVAVLPFESLSTNPENAIFASGVHREVLNSLAKLADLKVISRTSVMRYKPGTERNLKDIAQDLGVAFVVEGSVQREANHVVLTAELIEAANDTQVWAQNFDGDIADVLSFQNEIAERISNQLGAKLSQQERTDLAAKPTKDMAAFENYIRARALMEAGDVDEEHDKFVEDNKRAVQLLEQAVARDPKFAAAYWALTEANIQLFRSTNPPSLEYRARAEEALKGAQRLAPQAGETFHAESRVIYYGYGDFKRALAILEQAAKTLPNNAEVAMTRALLYRRFGRWQEAYSLFVRETELNPHDLTAYLLAAAVAQNLRWWPESDQIQERIAKRYPRRVRSVAMEHAVSLRQRGDVEAGNKELEKLNLQIPSEYVPRFYINFWNHNFEECRKLLPEVAKSPDPELQDDRWDKELQLFFVTKGSFDRQAALAAEKQLEERLQQSTNLELEESLVVSVSNVKMLLGKKDDAIRLCQKWVEKHPVSDDALVNVQALKRLAYVYLFAGDHERALQMLRKLVEVPGGENYGPLKYNPIFDELRNDPRFQVIVEQAKLPFPR
jgi:TolB-like protein/class 3 adenylate cyclase